MDAPVAMLTRAEAVFTDSVRNGSRPSPATTTSSKSLEPCRPTRRKPQMQNQTGRQSAQGRHQNTFPIRQLFRELHRVTGLNEVHRIIKEEVHQTADDADNSGQHEVESFLVEDKLFAPAQRALPVTADKIARPGHDPVFKPPLHDGNLPANGGS